MAAVEKEAGALSVAEGLDARKALKEEKKRFRQEQKAQRKEAKKRARELDEQEDELEYTTVGSPAPVLMITFIIVVVWVAILCLLIKLDVGGFGSTVLAPVLKNVPVVNNILPNTGFGEGQEEDVYMGYTDLKDAVDQIRKLELELANAQNASANTNDKIAALEAEIERLKTFEDSQLEFERVRKQFYDEVVYAENGPGAEAFVTYFQSMNPEEAARIYKETIQEEAASAQLEQYAKTYSEMKPANAAAIFETMMDDVDLVVSILGTMSAENRANILSAMQAENAATITKLMNPD